MKSDREVKNGVSKEEREVKKKRVMERSDSPPPPLGFNNPLLPLANAYNDDDDEEENEPKKSQTRGNGEPGDGVAKADVNGNKVRGETQEKVDDDKDDDEEATKWREKRSRHVEVRRDCPYLDTVNRQVLDFDFERFCSVSLSNLNVYACLVCGKYFQGRSQKSHAYTHSLEAGHHVYINLLTEKVYCLPDSYEINDPSLDDIRHVLNLFVPDLAPQAKWPIQ